MIFLIPILLTGMCSLVYQVVWQRYLTFLLGSESRSTTIIVAIFLLGLALGYFLFGKITKKYTDRKSLLKFYGWVELLTGFYAIIFPSFFWIIAESSFSQSNSYLMNIVLGFVLIIIPTILMGATVPLMTTVLPKSHLNINNFHSIIYGINTIGGFVGVLLGSFILIPKLGLEMTLVFSGIVNCFASLFYIGNILKGNIVSADDQSHIASSISSNTLLIWSFVSGLVIIGLEIIWFRLLGLTIGPSHLVFPFILSIFILGLGYGSLTSKVRSIQTLQKELSISYAFLIISFVIAPWLPWLISNLRVMLSSIGPAYYFFYVLVYAFLALILLPAIIPMGRLLPAIFSMTKKDDTNFGFKCGILYFTNTCGTFFGATVFGYLLLFVFDIDILYKTLILLYGSILICLLFSESKLNLKNILSCVMILAILVLPFNRKFHIEAPYRLTSLNDKLHFTNPFKFEYDDREVLFFEDGPDNTTAVARIHYTAFPEIISKSIFVNGKSDSNTIGDYPTLILSAIIPYLYSPTNTNLKASIIGAGTGVTAATLNDIPDINELHLVEISSSVTKALKHFDDVNNDLTRSSKLKIHQMDAFRYYRNLSDRHHIIISEPTNPWTVGVENLYTKYFYRLIANKLHDDGIFYQWFNLYAADDKILTSVLKNMTESFRFVEVYRTMNGDIGLIGSMKELAINPNFDRISINSLIIKLANAGISKPEYINALRIFNSHDVKAILKTNDFYDHDIDYPILNFLSLKPFFQQKAAHLPILLSPYIARRLTKNIDEQKIKILTEEMFNSSNNNEWCKRKSIIPNHYCEHMSEVVNQYKAYTTSTNISDRLAAYSYLRKERYIARNVLLLEEAEAKFKGLVAESIYVMQEYLKEGLEVQAQELRKSIESLELSHSQKSYIKSEWIKYTQYNDVISK